MFKTYLKEGVLYVVYMYIKLLCPYFKFVKSPPELTYFKNTFVFAYANVIYKLVKYMHHALIRHVYKIYFLKKVREL